MGRSCEPRGPRAREPDGRAPLLPVAAAGRPCARAAGPGRTRGRRRVVRSRPARVLPATGLIALADRGQRSVQHCVGHASPVKPISE